MAVGYNELAADMLKVIRHSASITLLARRASSLSQAGDRLQSYEAVLSLDREVSALQRTNQAIQAKVEADKS